MRITVRDIGYEIGIMPGQKKPSIILIDDKRAVKLGSFKGIYEAQMFVDQLEKMMTILGVPMDKEKK